jgi:molybdenum cofactor biosynthesis protein B
MPTRNHSDEVIKQVACAILTISDTRTPQTDESGALIRARLEAAGHRIQDYDVLPDDPQRVRRRVTETCERRECQVVLLSGGTGIATRDSTYEAIGGLLDKKLDGFGELFRNLSFQEIGSAAMLSRAVAGICNGTAVFSMPGSTPAVRLAMDRLILPELGHVAALLAD